MFNLTKHFLQDGEVASVIPVDFQMIFYGNPVTDFIFFIFICTDRKFRDQHLNNLKDMYFDTLRNFLKYFDMDVNDYYPRKEFETFFEQRFDYSLMVIMYFFPFFYAPDDSIPDLSNSSFRELDYALGDDTNERVKEIFDECVELGFL